VSENSAKVVVAMSGGVDSSVAAALLIEQGYQVIGMMLRLWSEQGRQIDNRCCTPEAMALARRVAAILSIPFYVVDAKQAHRLAVVQSFTEGYLAGITPNPCLECNRQIRWGLLLDRARTLGADYLATGHYARVVQNADGPVQLLKAIDEQKDQSYVLHMFSQQELSQTLLPLGELTKSQVRQKARQLGLPVADRKESQDLCFLAGNDYRDFLSRNAPGANNPGPILDSAGNPLGEHQGLPYYTIGQRKGLGITSAKPLYVISKDLQRNALVVGPLTELGSDQLFAGPMNWVSGSPPEHPFRAQVKIRYRANAEWAHVTPEIENRISVRFDQKIRDITPGQAAVLYSGDVCLGGGLIQPDCP
jgi:tRNA-specific 2-thiouridylase